MNRGSGGVGLVAGTVALTCEIFPNTAMKRHSTIQAVTRRIGERSRPLRSSYLKRLADIGARDRGSDRLGCANVAHAVAGAPANDKLRIVAERGPNIGIVTPTTTCCRRMRRTAATPKSSSTRHACMAPPRRLRAACLRCATA